MTNAASSWTRRGRSRRLLLALCVAAGILPAAAEGAAACSCAGVPPQEYAETADVVFTGVARNAEGDEVRRVTTFTVRLVYKGRARRSTEVTTAAHSATCGIRFQRGTTYTVFASRSDAGLSTNLCSGTKRGRIRHERYGLPPGRRL